MKCAWCGADLTDCKQVVHYDGQVFCPDPQCREEWAETYPKPAPQRPPITGRVHLDKANINEVPKRPTIYLRDVVVNYILTLGGTEVAQLVGQLADQGKEVLPGDELGLKEIQAPINQAAERCQDERQKQLLERFQIVLHVPIRY